MRWTQFFIPTLKETPADAEISSHQLLLRAGLVRACAAADFPSGISYVVDPRKITYVNPDLTVHMHRLPVGEWVMVDARTWLEPNGTGFAEGALYDETNRIGRRVQGLLIEPRSVPRPPPGTVP